MEEKSEDAPVPLAADEAGKKEEDTRAKITDPQDIIEKVGKWILFDTNFGVYNSLNDWDAMALALGGLEVPRIYYPVVKDFVVVNKAITDKSTDIQRTLMGITAAGLNPENVGGFNLVEKIYNHPKMLSQDANAATYALIALDTRKFEVPENALWTRSKLIERLLTFQQEDGSFIIGTEGRTSSDPDTTAMAIQALASYQDRQEVKAAIERALNWLSSVQTRSGGFVSAMATNGEESSESSAQVVIALSALGIDSKTDPRFVKQGGSVWDALSSFIYVVEKNPDYIAFRHMHTHSVVNVMATHQGVLAAVAYKRFLDGKSRLYDMTDVVQIPEPAENRWPTTAEPEIIDFTQEQIDTGILIVVAQRTRNLIVTIPAENKYEVKVEPYGTTVPGLDVKYGDVSFYLPRTRIQLNGSKLLLPNVLPDSPEKLQRDINLQIAPAKIKEVKSAIRFGGKTSTSFEGHATITFNGQGDYQAGYYDENDQFHPIPLNKDASLAAYSYEEDGNLVVKINRFAAIVTYRPDNSGGNPSPGSGGSDPAVKLSIEKISINEGYIVEPVLVPLAEGDTAYSLMRRYALNRNISIRAIGSGSTLYVQGIDGLSEFDHGPYSGWMYSVNGVYPDHSADTKFLKDGDVLRWRYTKDLGKDIGGYDSIVSSNNREELQKKLAEVQALKEADYTASSWRELKRVIDLVENALKDNAYNDLELVKLLRELIDAQRNLVPAATLLENLNAFIQKSADWILKNTDFKTYDPFHDWDAIALVRSGKQVPDTYYRSLESYVKEVNGSFRKVTDYERTVMAVAAIGKDPAAIAGFDFLEKIYNNERLTAQGTNGAIYALIAFDAAGAKIPLGAKWNRERLIDWLLTQQNKDGGFPLSKDQDGESDVDVTAMSLQALAGYQHQDKVKQARDQALEWLSRQQLENGGMNAWGKENSESVSQVIIALSALGIPLDDKRFVKEKGNLHSNLIRFVNADGGIAHSVGGESNFMATHQGLLGLLAHKRFLQKEKALYDFSDIRKTGAQMEGKPDISKLFKDESNISPWAVDAVHKAAAAGFVQGTGASGQFMPEHEMTRAEFAAVLVRYLGLNIEEQTNSVYTDVMTDRWYAASIAAASKAGIVTGSGAGAFRPGESLTRQEMAVMLGRALGFADARQTSGKQPSDLQQVSPWAAPSVTYLYQAGLMTGENGAFSPAGHVTRELAVFILMQFYESDKQAA
ncbi:S-layer homology domain-containing protein [Paenibacillus sp. GCM10012307]|uniref:Geranylgeranyl transferase type II subunit beta n=1 Tax=Paenibacillus roseus TaxID=2798579 RepID=A0A934J6Y0_9BACL|nr:S-layer homology domain-containing protein [Paenibacillus roseus]MBJ6361866.1 S-layer homology domain-containing protein [Paenibacillus roseus]